MEILLYFEPFLIPRHSAYSTRRSQSDGVILKVPHSVFKSRKHFGLSSAYDEPTIWNDVPEKDRSANSLASFRSKLKSYLFGKAYQPYFSPPFSTVLTPAMSLVYEYRTMFFGLMRLRVCLLTEIKHYKSAVRIRIVSCLAL